MTQPTAEATTHDAGTDHLTHPALDAPTQTPPDTGFAYAHLTDPQALDLLASQGMTATDALAQLPAARTWPGPERDALTAALDAATADADDEQAPTP